jgi:hypothetical protein
LEFRENERTREREREAKRQGEGESDQRRRKKDLNRATMAKVGIEAGEAGTKREGRFAYFNKWVYKVCTINFTCRSVGRYSSFKSPRISPVDKSQVFLFLSPFSLPSFLFSFLSSSSLPSEEKAGGRFYCYIEIRDL